MIRSRLTGLAWRAWTVRLGAFTVAASGGLVGLNTLTDGFLASSPTEIFFARVLLVAAVWAGFVALPAWWLVVRDPRRGPAWGALGGAMAGLAGVVLVVLALFDSHFSSISELVHAGALVLVFFSPITVAATIAGALLELEP